MNEIEREITPRTDPLGGGLRWEVESIKRYLDEQWETELYPEGGAPPAEHPELARIKASQLSDSFMRRVDQIREFVLRRTGIDPTVTLTAECYGTIAADFGEGKSIISTVPTDSYAVIEENLRACGWPAAVGVEQLREDVDFVFESFEDREGICLKFTLKDEYKRLRAALDELEAWRAL
jgi:hypothetical protein